MNTTATPATTAPVDKAGHRIATHVTVAEGMTARQYEQTASRDHDVDLTPGTYPLTAHYSPEKWLTHYTASIPAVAHDHWSSTVEFGGVALAGEQRGGEAETHGFHVYAYDTERIGSLTGYSFTYLEA